MTTARVSRIMDPMTTQEKFKAPFVTADGQARATVALSALRTLWFNTGTLCNLTCANCYIESSPRNDSLVYLTTAEVAGFLDEIARDDLPTREIGLTGGEPFMNPDIMPIMEMVLARGFSLLVLTNAMRPMMRHRQELRALRAAHGDRLTIRVSVDHHDRRMHEEERGPGSWEPMMTGLKWLSAHGFNLHLAGRTRWGEAEADLRSGYARLCAAEGINIDADDPQALMLFPEMDAYTPVPEITTACWGILGVDPGDMMCATSRMVVRHRGDDLPSVMACTLIAHDAGFNRGRTLAEAAGPVALNHPHCARFCVLGGGACSR
ncbi:MAG: radical SAM protein [Sphingomonadales bacterium]